MLRSVLLPCLLLVLACSGSLNAVVESRTLPPAAAAPRILAVTDLGVAEVPRSGRLQSRGSDGAASIGEALWVQGADLGREPSVSIGGRQTMVLARTGDGGLVLRVPPGTPAGAQPLVVANEHGAGQRMVTVRRRVVVLPPEGGSLAWAELGSEGAAAPASMLLPGAALLAVSADGRAAYVASSKDSLLHVIDLAAPRVPSETAVVDVGGSPALVLAVAARADVLACVRGEDVVMVDIGDPLHPVPGVARRLPQAVREAQVRDAALSPDGALMAVIGAGGNVVHLVELSSSVSATLVGAATVSEGDAGQLREIAFAQDGHTVWVLASETRTLGDWVPVQVHAAHIRGEPGARFSLDIVHSVVAGRAADPVSIGLGRNGFVAGGAVWQPPQATTLYLSAGVRDEKRSALFRLTADGVTEVARSDAPLGELVVSPDGRWLLAAERREDGSLWLVSAVAEERDAPSGERARPASLRLASSHSSEPVRGPARIRIQP